MDSNVAGDCWREDSASLWGALSSLALMLWGYGRTRTVGVSTIKGNRYALIPDTIELRQVR